MLRITYSYSYFGRTEPREPIDAVRTKAESARECLHPERTHVYRTNDTGTAPLTTLGLFNPAWIVTFTPETDHA